jgi:hypothetical protein
MSISQQTPFTSSNSKGQDKDMSFVEVLDKHATELADNFERMPSFNVVVISPTLVAIDLWIFKYDTKYETWSFSTIYRTRLLEVLALHSYNKRYRSNGGGTFFIQGDQIIEEVIEARIQDATTAYINSDTNLLRVEYQEGQLSASYAARLEKFLNQTNLFFNGRFLSNLPTHTRPFLRDTATTCYIPFQNGIVQITANKVRLQPYSILEEGCVWKSQVLPRNYIPNAIANNCHFKRFIENVAGHELERIQSMRSAIGFLIHDYNGPSEGQAVICYDEQITDTKTPQGGTGKGLFANALKQMRPVAALDGKKFDPNDRFCFQQISEATSIAWIDDPKHDFQLERFFSLQTEGWTIEQKNQATFKIDPKESPKLLITTNVVLNNEGSSNIRRQFILEFSDYYKKKIQTGREKPIEAEHGCVFFSEDWDVEEWGRFDSFMIDCVQFYLKHGQQYCTPRNVNRNRLLQTTGDDFYEWVTTYENGQGLQPDKDYITADLFFDFKSRYFLGDEVKQRGFSANICKYARSKNLEYKRGNSNSNPTFRLMAASKKRE